jgi:hypothetical protein
MSKLKLPQAPRTIRIIPKHTGAATQYYDIDADSEAYLYDWMIKFLADITEVATHNPDIQREYFQRKPKLFPKGQHGPNSFASMLAGIISAKLHNPRHNLSEPVLESIELIFDTLVEYYTDMPNPPERVNFRTSLFDAG